MQPLLLLSLTKLYNDREKSRNASLIVSMDGSQTCLKDPDNPTAEPRRFTFDYSYWSHDQYTERSDGYLEPSGKKYADQVCLMLSLCGVILCCLL